MTPEQLAELAAPFKDEEIGKLPRLTCKKCTDAKGVCDGHQRRKCRTCNNTISSAHMHLDYVGHAHVTERLTKVDPQWTWDPIGELASGLPALDDNGGLWIRLTVCGVTRPGYGDAAGKRGGNAVKEAIGDAIRNAAMRFGVALDLWKKETPQQHDDVPERQVERPAQTPEQRAAELRGQIAAICKRRNKSIGEIEAEFIEWSRGKEIGAASVAVLVEYRAHLEGEAS